MFVTQVCGSLCTLRFADLTIEQGPMYREPRPNTTHLYYPPLDYVDVLQYLD